MLTGVISSQPTKLSNDPQVQSSFILKRMRDLQEKNKEVQDAQQRRNEETLLVFSGLQMYLGECPILVQEITLINLPNETIILIQVLLRR